MCLEDSDPRKKHVFVFITTIRKHIQLIFFPAIDADATLAVMTQPLNKVPSRALRPCMPPPPKPAASPTAYRPSI